MRRVFIQNGILDKRQELATANSETFKRAVDSVKSAELTSLKSELDTLYKQDLSAKKNISSFDSLKSTLPSDLIKDIPFPFKTMFYFTNSLSSGLRTLILLITVTIFYLAYCRYLTFKYISKAVRLYKHDRTLTTNKLYELNISVPFWLAPMPSKISDEDRSGVLPAELRKYFGWNSSERFYTCSVVLILLLLLLLEGRLIYLSNLYTAAKLGNMVFWLNYFMMCITVCAMISWLMPIKIPDRYNSEETHETMLRRRYILLFAGSLLLFSVGFANTGRLRKKFSWKTIYKNRKPKNYNTRLSEGLYKHKHSKKIHYIDSKGRSISFNYARLTSDNLKFAANLRLLTDEQLNATFISTHITKKDNAWHVENAALFLLRKNKPADAFTLIESMCMSDVRNYRMIDLYIRLYENNRFHKYASQNFTNKFEEVFGERNDKKLNSRISRLKQLQNKKELSNQQLVWNNQTY